MGQKIQDRAERERREANELKQQVDMIRKGVEKIATGDLTMRFDASDNGALSQLTNHLNSMIEGLAAMSRQISEASISMNTTITEVQSVIYAQSSGATQQAASINETTPTLTEIKATANQTLEKAIALGKSAELTRLHKAMRSVVNNLNSISSSLQSDTRMLRLVPVSTLLKPALRIARDIARELGKKGGRYHNRR